KAKLVITAITRLGLTQAEAAQQYGVSQPTVSRWMARYRAEGEAAFEPRSRRPSSNPRAISSDVIEAVTAERDRLVASGHDAGPDTIAWHLQRAGITAPSRATIARILTRSGRVRPEPKKKPRSAYIRFEADQPNQCWQSDFTHTTLQAGRDVEVITWLDDHSRMALHISAHPRITGPIVLATFRSTIAEHGCPASTLTDNGMVYTVRHSAHGVRGGRNAFEHELATLGVTQKNGRGNHPQTQGKVERFQQTLKNWLRRQPTQPATIEQLQTLLDRFQHEYNHQRPHRALNRRTPAAAYQARPKAAPPDEPTARTHARVRTDRVNEGTITLRHAGRLHHIGIGRALNGHRVLVLVHDLEITVVHADTGEIIRQLTLDPTRDYQPQNSTKPPNP
ncbi:IS481 family transposase, partial [Janibacter sp. Y6]|uniref:IS481 family transposase n=1 Tax=Janibacter sp. Y6 TaxID=2913552 RepID=UPI0034A2AC7F